jgi:hypothetical protein
MVNGGSMVAVAGLVIPMVGCSSPGSPSGANRGPSSDASHGGTRDGGAADAPSAHRRSDAAQPSSDAAHSSADAGCPAISCPPLYCDGGCSNGILTVCEVLSPGEPNGCPACSPGIEMQQEVCFYGCGSDRYECRTSPTDAAIGCSANRVMVQQGMFGGDASPAVALAQFQASDGPVILIATNAATACAATLDAGIAPDPGNVAVLSIPTQGQTGTFSQSGATLTSWSDGGLTTVAASQGNLSIGLVEPGQGVMGTYDLLFGTSLEHGSFTAPACNVCALGSGR